MSTNLSREDRVNGNTKSWNDTNKNCDRIIVPEALDIFQQINHAA